MTKTTADVWVGSTPAVWEMTGKRSTGQLEGAAGPSSDFQPTPVSSLRKRSKGQDRVESAQPTRERRAGRAGDIAELAELIDALLRALAELRIRVRIASAISVLLSGGKLLAVHLVRLQDTLGGPG